MRQPPRLVAPALAAPDNVRGVDPTFDDPQAGVVRADPGGEAHVALELLLELDELELELVELLPLSPPPQAPSVMLRQTAAATAIDRIRSQGMGYLGRQPSESTPILRAVRPQW